MPGDRSLQAIEALLAEEAQGGYTAEDLAQARATLLRELALAEGGNQESANFLTQLGIPFAGGGNGQVEDMGAQGPLDWAGGSWNPFDWLGSIGNWWENQGQPVAGLPPDMSPSRERQWSPPFEAVPGYSYRPSGNPLLWYARDDATSEVYEIPVKSLASGELIPGGWKRIGSVVPGTWDMETTEAGGQARRVAQLDAIEKALGKRLPDDIRARYLLGFALPGAEGAGGLTPYQAAQLEIDRRRLGLSEAEFGRSQLETSLQAARTGNPLTYLGLIRGAVPGYTGGEIYQGLNRSVPPVEMPMLPPSNRPFSPEESVPPYTPFPQNQGMPQAGQGGPMSLIQKYFPPEQWQNAYNVMMAESGGRNIPSGFNVGGGEDSHGLFQINLRAHPEMAGKVYDPEANVAYAAKLWSEQGWNPWSAARNLGLHNQGGGAVPFSPTAMTGGNYFNYRPWEAPPMPPAMAKVSAGEPLGKYQLPPGTLRPPGAQAQGRMSPFESQAMSEAVQYQGVPEMDWLDTLRRTRQSVGRGLPLAGYGGRLRA